MTTLQSILSFAIGHEDIFGEVLRRFEQHDKATKGRLWEELCQKYLLAKGYDHVYTTHIMDPVVARKLGFTVRGTGVEDAGIDLVAVKNNRYSAIQCKYRKRDTNGVTQITHRSKPTTSGNMATLGKERVIKVRRNTVPWKQLSTFYGLCAETGPWSELIVMTTANSIAHKGKKKADRKTLAFGTFNSKTRSPRALWLEMAGSKGHRLTATTTPDTATTTSDTATTTPEVQSTKPVSDLEALRAKRLAYYA